MTNKELIAKLQETVKEYGELPVCVSVDCLGNRVSNIKCNGSAVVIYDF